MVKHILLSIASLMVATSASAQYSVSEKEQRSFNNIPSGNYSGITNIGGNKYAVVSDKSPKEGFFVFNIDIDSISGKIKDIKDIDFKGNGTAMLDEEGITFVPNKNTVLVSCEKDNVIREYDLNGNRSGRFVAMAKSRPNYGNESLTYNNVTKTIWTCSESTLPQDGLSATSENRVENRLRIVSLDDSLNIHNQYPYLMDVPTADGEAFKYAMGVSELLALDDGSLLVLEREFYVPKLKLGAYVSCKIYNVMPFSEYIVSAGAPITDNTRFLPKKLICSWRTHLRLLKIDIANYEGMCLGPKLKDGGQVIVLVSDSQNQYKGVMKDWFKTIVIRE